MIMRGSLTSAQKTAAKLQVVTSLVNLSEWAAGMRY